MSRRLESGMLGDLNIAAPANGALVGDVERLLADTAALES